MKKVFAIFAVAAFVACNNSSESTEVKADSAAATQTVVADSAAAKVDSATATPAATDSTAKADTTKK